MMVPNIIPLSLSLSHVILVEYICMQSHKDDSINEQVVKQAVLQAIKNTDD
jgi:hypothetical protein